MSDDVFNPSHSYTFPMGSVTSKGGASIFPPFDGSKMKYDMLFGDKDSPKAKITIGSYDDMQSLINGEAVDVNWYRMADEGWEFMERRPFRMAFKKGGEGK